MDKQKSKIKVEKQNIYLKISKNKLKVSEI